MFTQAGEVIVVPRKPLLFVVGDRLPRRHFGVIRVQHVEVDNVGLGVRTQAASFGLSQARTPVQGIAATRVMEPGGISLVLLVIFQKRAIAVAL